MDVLKAVFCCFDGGDDASYSETKPSNEPDSDVKPLLEKQPFDDYSSRAAYSTFKLEAHPNNPEDTISHFTSAQPPPCLDPEDYRYINEKTIADGIVRTLYEAETWDDLPDDLRPQDWTDTLARQILNGMVTAIESGKVMGGAFEVALNEVAPEVKNFVHEHPVLTAVVTTLVAICVLEYMVSWTVTALGFGDLGPLEGSFEAWWQSMYGDVPYGSLFSLLQRFGMRPLEVAIWKEFVNGEHIYVFEDEFQRIADAENDLLHHHILPNLFCAESCDDLEKAMCGILWTQPLRQALFDALYDSEVYSEGFPKSGLMQEAVEKASERATAMGFFVGAPKPDNPSPRPEEGSLDPFIVHLGMLSIMVPSIIEALGFHDEHGGSSSMAAFWPHGYSNAQYTSADFSYLDLSVFLERLSKAEETW